MATRTQKKRYTLETNEVDSSKKPKCTSEDTDKERWMGHTKDHVFQLHKLGAVSALHKSYGIKESFALNIYSWLYEDKAKPCITGNVLQENTKETFRETCEKGSVQALGTLYGVGTKKSPSLSKKIEEHKTREATDVVGASLSLTFNAFLTSTMADSIMRDLSACDDDMKATIMKNVQILKGCLQHGALLKAYINYCRSLAAHWKNADNEDDSARKTKTVMMAFDMDAMRADPWGQLKNICPKNFKAVDEFAIANDWWHNESPSRVRTILDRLFTDDDRSGNTLTLKEQAASYMQRYDISAYRLDQLIREGDLYHHTVRNEKFVSVHRVVRDEMIIHAGIGFLSDQKPLTTEASVDELLAMASTQLQKQMTSEQEAAVRAFFDHRLVCICGAGGTGKSSVCISSIISIAEEAAYDVVCLAPTHKAKKKLVECVQHIGGKVDAKSTKDGVRVSTFQAFTNTFFSGGCPTTNVVVVVDEASMISSQQMSEFMQGIFEYVNLRVVVCGDPSQCRPIGCGSPFVDMISSQLVQTVNLTVQKRAPINDIIRFTNLFRQDNTNQFWTLRPKPNNFWSTMEAGDKHVKTKFNTLEESSERMLKAASDYKEILLKLQEENMDMLDASNLRTLCATNDHCRFFAQYFREVVLGSRSENFLVGERCQFSINTEFFKNGDVATVCAYEEDGEWVDVAYKPDPHEYESVMAAYKKQKELSEKSATRSRSASTILILDVIETRVVLRIFHKTDVIPDCVLTVHKAQGAECRVCIVIFPQPGLCCARSDVMYTAVSRARERLCIVGHLDAFNGHKVRPAQNPPRLTLLSFLLGNDASFSISASQIKYARSERQRISKGLRNAVWKSYCGEKFVAACFVCTGRVTCQDYHCAHVVAVCRGGDNKLENLRVCCSQCNLTMGTENLDDFRAKRAAAGLQEG